jgi:hypothetical protein
LLEAGSLVLEDIVLLFPIRGRGSGELLNSMVKQISLLVLYIYAISEIDTNHSQDK